MVAPCLAAARVAIGAWYATLPCNTYTGQAETFPNNTPQSKEEYYYRSVFEKYYPDCDKFVHVWDGGCVRSLPPLYCAICFYFTMGE